MSTPAPQAYTHVALGADESVIVDAFIDTVEDLRSRTRLTASDYDCVQAAGLLRRLLIDQKPLGPRATKLLGETVQFEWQLTYRYWDGWWALDPMFHPALTDHMLAGQPTLEREKGDRFRSSRGHGGVEQLLHAQAFGYRDNGDQYLSVRELTKQIAEDEGGVHVDMHTARSSHLRAALLSPYRRYVLQGIIGIGRVVVAGYEPIIARRLVFAPLVHQDPARVESKKSQDVHQAP